MTNKIKLYLKNNKFSIIILFIVLICIFAFSLIVDHFKGNNSIICSFVYHVLINQSVIGWFSGFGSLSAAIVALFINREKSPNLIPKGYCDPQYKELIIQIINNSRAADFIELENIFFSNKINKNGQYHKIMVPKVLRKYEAFHAVNGKDVYTLIMKRHDIYRLLKQYFKSGKKYLIFNFKDLSKNQIMLIPFPKQELMRYDYNRLRKHIKIKTKIVHIPTKKRK